MRPPQYQIVRLRVAHFHSQSIAKLLPTKHAVGLFKFKVQQPFHQVQMSLNSMMIKTSNLEDKSCLCFIWLSFYSCTFIFSIVFCFANRDDSNQSEHTIIYFLIILKNFVKIYKFLLSIFLITTSINSRCQLQKQDGLMHLSSHTIMSDMGK